jgi:hypothetical protein
LSKIIINVLRPGEKIIILTDGTGQGFMQTRFLRGPLGSPYNAALDGAASLVFQLVMSGVPVDRKFRRGVKNVFDFIDLGMELERRPEPEQEI